jgi:hypothetical protein
VSTVPDARSHQREISRLQADLNRWTERWLTRVPKLQVDGDKGPATNRRIMTVKWYLGYEGERDGKVTETFKRRMAQPRNPFRSSPAQVARGIARRRRQDQEAHDDLHPRPGVSTYDGRPCAAWLRPYLVWAKEQGWQGTLVSGWRDPVYSEQLCYRMCGAPSCPGRCAGRASNHSGSEKPKGALDVSDYTRFGQLMQRCPHQPRIFNALGPADPVHFSASGR